MNASAASLLNLLPSKYHSTSGDTHSSDRERGSAMRPKGANGVGRCSVEFEVVNYGDPTLVDRGLLQADQDRRQTIQGVVDSGTTKLVLPQAVVKRLGLPLGNPVKVRYADGRQARRP
jgi:hypothetical protein